MFYFFFLYYLYGYDNGGLNFIFDWGWLNFCIVDNSMEKWNIIVIFFFDNEEEINKYGRVKNL